MYNELCFFIGWSFLYYHCNIKELNLYIVFFAYEIGKRYLLLYWLYRNTILLI